MARAEKTKQPRAKAGFFTKVLILVLLAALGGQLHHLRGQVAQAEAEKARYEAKVEAQ